MYKCMGCRKQYKERVVCPNVQSAENNTFKFICEKQYDKRVVCLNVQYEENSTKKEWYIIIYSMRKTGGQKSSMSKFRHATDFGVCI